MARIETVVDGGQPSDTSPTKAKKRKLKHTPNDDDSVQTKKADSPTTKFNKMRKFMPVRYRNPS